MPTTTAATVSRAVAEITTALRRHHGTNGDCVASVRQSAEGSRGGNEFALAAGVGCSLKERNSAVTESAVDHGCQGGRAKPCGPVLLARAEPTAAVDQTAW